MAKSERADSVVTLVRRGRTDLKANRHADALEVFARVVRREPDAALARCDLARAHFYLGEVSRATKHLRKASRTGASVKALGPLAWISAFDPVMSHAAVLRYRRAFSDALGARSGKGEVIRAARIAQRRTLRIGYVCSFFQWENWMKPVWGLIDHHNPERVETHLFSGSSQPALVRRRARSAGARFHDISRLSNRQAASLIARSGIDVLVDLNGFSRRERLELFLAKPAPLQVAWFNIFGTTGMPCFDALIGDEWVIQTDEERWYVERVIRLPMSYLTFEVTYPVPPVRPPPCLLNDFITFGSLASLYKLDDGVIRAWAEILRRCPDSRLILRNALLNDEGNKKHTIRRFSDQGVHAERLTLLGGAPHYDFLKTYDSIDIALDTFPYNGGTTTTEAIWQGVPVIAFAGDRWISRTSASLLANAGLEQFVCRNVEGYVSTAVRLGNSAKSGAWLRRWRISARTRLRRSSVCDCDRFAQLMEDTYEELWRRRDVGRIPATVSRPSAARLRKNLPVREARG